MDQHELRPHPLRNVWRWIGVLFIVASAGNVWLRNYDKAVFYAVLAGVFLAMPYFRKWKRKVDGQET